MAEGRGAAGDDPQADLSASGARKSGPHDEEALGPTLRGSPGASSGGGELAIGALLNDTYRVEKCIGRGAMGAVYLVEHVALGKKFAAKVVTGAHASDPAAFVRLRNEARAASAIEHESIVNVTDLGQCDGALFVVMELLRGQDLRARMEEQLAKNGDPWLPDALSREVFDQVLSALDAAHAKGIVHRDLKPDNIFLATKSDGGVRAKIVDFGISKLQQSDHDLRLTATGQIIGTPLYMAPEQTRSGAPIDHRTDLYSMGVIAFEMVTGQLPFSATNLYEIVLKHASEPAPPPRTAREGLPDAVGRVIMKCLEKKPDDRYQSAAELRAAWAKAWDEGIGPVLPQRVSAVPAQAEPAPLPTKSFPLLPVLAIGLVIAAGGIGYAVWPSAPDPEPRPVERAVAPEPRPAIEEPLPEPAPVPEPPPEVRITRTLTTAPEGATVLRDGREIGVTPLPIELAQGEQANVEIRMDGYRVETRTISEADPESIAIALRRERSRPNTSILAPR